jgi:hypothetical protein
MIGREAKNRPARARWLEWAIGLAGYLAMAIVTTWPLAKHPATLAPSHWGDVLLNAYALAWDQHALLHAPASIFNPPFVHPSPHALCLSENLIAPALLTLPLAPLDNPILTYNIVLMGALVASAWTMRWLLRAWGLGPAAAWLGGLLWGFSPWRFGCQLAHLQYWLAWWIPMALLGAERWARGEGGRWWAALAGAALAAQFYSCVYLFYFALLDVGVATGVGLWLAPPPRRQWRAMAAQALAGGAILAALLAPAYGPYRDAATAVDDNGLLSMSSSGASLGDYLRIDKINLLSGSLGWLGENPYSLSPWEHRNWPGWVALAGTLALPVAWRLARRRRGAWRALQDGLGRRCAMLLAGGTFMFLVSLGPVLHAFGKPLAIWPFYLALYRWLPGFASIRVPPRAGGALVGLTLCALAAMAVDAAMAVARRRGRWAWSLVATMALAAGVLDLLNRPLPATDNPDVDRHRAVNRMLAKQPTQGARLVLPMDPDYGYVAVLASTPDFAPLMIGMPGHASQIYRSIRYMMNLRQWDRRQPDAIRWLGVGRVVYDRRVAALDSLSPPIESLRTALAQAGLLLGEHDFPAQQIVVFDLKLDPGALSSSPQAPAFQLAPTVSAIVPEPLKGDAWLSWLMGAQMTFQIASESGARVLEDAQRPMTVWVRCRDRSGQELWTGKFRQWLPHFMLAGQRLGYKVEVPVKAWQRCATIELMIRLPGLNLSLQRTCAPEKAPVAP